MLRLVSKKASTVAGRPAVAIIAMLIVIATPGVMSAQSVWNDSTTRALVELASQIEALRGEIARMRGQFEVRTQEAWEAFVRDEVSRIGR